MKMNLKSAICFLMVLLIVSLIGCDKNSVSRPDTEKETVELSVKIKNDPVIIYTKEKNPDFSSSGHSKLSPWTENAPIIYKTNTGKNRAYIVNDKTICFDILSGKTVLDDNYFDTLSGKLSVWPSNVSYSEKRYLMPEEIGKADLWRAVYYTAFSVWSDDTTTYSINHGENKNSMITASGKQYFYKNTVKPADTQYDNDDYSGDFGDGYKDVWDNYFAFVCSSASSNEDVTKSGNLMKEDYGPIVWPDNGYLDEWGESVTTGPRHPCAIVYEDHIYVYYSIDKTIRVVRAPVSGGAKPGTFKKYFNGGFDEPALPNDFNKDDRSFVYKISGMSSPIIESDNPIQFSVAHLKDTEYFVGILEETDKDGHFISISVSKDLVNWSKPQELPDTRCKSWDEGNFHYPKIYSRDFSNSMEVSADGFFVSGTSSNHGGWLLPQYLPLAIEIEEK